MSMGEHELHNKEYELLQWLGSPEAAAVSPSGFAVACGDGILFDSDCRELMEKGTVVIADPVASPSELWTAASADEGIPYAFMTEIQHIPHCGRRIGDPDIVSIPACLLHYPGSRLELIIDLVLAVLLKFRKNRRTRTGRHFPHI